MEMKNSINLRFNDHKQKGLYLYFPDSSKLILTRDVIEQTATEFWNDPAKISPEVKEAAEFQRCHFCPAKAEEGLCNAIRPVFPLLEDIDKYVSYDKVTAVYIGDEPDIYYVSNTTMHVALSYISSLSLMNYCLNGRLYWRYYLGIMPFTGDVTLAAARFYMNIYWFHKGNQEEIDKVVSKLQEELRTKTKNQIDRLNMICKNDAFMNAFVHAQITSEFISEQIVDNVLQAHMEAQNNNEYFEIR